MQFGASITSLVHLYILIMINMFSTRITKAWPSSKLNFFRGLTLKLRYKNANFEKEKCNTHANQRAFWNRSIFSASGRNFYCSVLPLTTTTRSWRAGTKENNPARVWPHQSACFHWVRVRALMACGGYWFRRARGPTGGFILHWKTWQCMWLDIVNANRTFLEWICDYFVCCLAPFKVIWSLKVQSEKNNTRSA